MQNSNSLFNTNDGPAPTQEQYQEDPLPFQGAQGGGQAGGGGGGLPAGIPPGLIPPGMEGMAAQAMQNPAMRAQIERYLGGGAAQ